ncbi:MAG: sigma-70 family RNA polymerase sigma factor [bacterium]|nr:sigma-70 family RNA polymerase sigma factor [bacterium]
MNPIRQPSEPPKSGFHATLALARAGDADALAELFEQFYPAVQRMVHRSLSKDLRVNRPWLATRFSTGDVVQEVFRSVLKDIGVFAGTSEESFRGYLTMVVRNRLMDSIRFHEAARRDGRRTHTSPEESELTSPHDGPATDVTSAEEMEAFHQVLSSFSEREQLLLRARLEQQAPFRSLADQLGYPSASAARRAFYAAQATLVLRLRQHQLDQGEDGPERPRGRE